MSAEGEGLRGQAEAYTDGASRGNPGPCAYAFIILVEGEVASARSGYLGRCTNNEAEYSAVINALEEALSLGIRRIRVFSDSALVVNQLTGRWRIKDRRMALLASRVREMASRFERVEFLKVPRENPHVAAADAMCNRVLDEVARGDYSFG